MIKSRFRATGFAAAVALSFLSTVGAKPIEYICYSPYRDGQAPGTGSEPTEAQIREDFKILAPLVKGIRTYSSTGIHSQIPKLALEAGLEVYVGAWVGKDEIGNLEQVNALIALAKSKNPAIKGLIIGNEVLLRQDVTKARLIEYIRMVGIANTGIPITTADIYQRIAENSADLLPVVDYVMAHVHPFWEARSAANGAKHVLDSWNQVKAKYPGKRVIIGETGFPSAGQTQGEAVPSEAAQSQFTENLMEVSAKEGLSFMLFTSFDEAWKGEEGPVGANWGLWRTDRTEKPAVAKVRSLNTVTLRLPGRSLRLRSEVAGLGLDALGRLRTGAAEAHGRTEAAALPVWTINAP